MSKYLGRNISVGLGKPATRGTAKTPDYWIPVTKLDHSDKSEKADLSAGLGTSVPAFDSVVTSTYGKGGFSAYMGDKHLGLILLGLFGTDTPTAESAPNALAYDHAFTVTDNAINQDLAITVKNPVDNKEYDLSMLDSFEIKFEAKKVLEYTAGFSSKGGSAVVSTPAFAVENYFKASDVSFKVAANLAGLAAASPLNVKSANLKIEKSVENYDVLGSTTPNDINNKSFKITGNFVIAHEASTYEASYLAGTSQALRFDAVSSATIATSAHPELKIDLAKVVFSDYARDNSIDNIVFETVSFTGYYSIADAKAITATLTNLVAAY